MVILSATTPMVSFFRVIRVIPCFCGVRERHAVFCNSPKKRLMDSIVNDCKISPREKNAKNKTKTNLEMCFERYWSLRSFAIQTQTACSGRDKRFLHLGGVEDRLWMWSLDARNQEPACRKGCSGTNLFPALNHCEDYRTLIVRWAT